MNAVLFERVLGPWSLGGWSVGGWLVVVSLLSEGALLFVAAQTGFIDGPRVLSNMAVDSWMPHSFANLSERLVTKNGIVLMAATAAALMVYSRGKVSFLVVLYAINVFITFSLTQVGMARMWITERRRHRGWAAKTVLHVGTLLLCVAILVITTLEKFTEGGWLTYAITVGLICVAVAVRRHYRGIQREITEIDGILRQIPTGPAPADAKPIDRNAPVAILLVSGYGGLGVHALLSIQRLFPGYYRNVVFVTVGVVDSGHFKGKAEMDSLVANTEEGLRRYVEFARRLGLAADGRFVVGTDVALDAEVLCQEVGREYPKGIVFLGKLVFAQEKFYYRLLHNDTAAAIQRRLHFAGVPTIVLPIRMGLNRS